MANIKQKTCAYCGKTYTPKSNNSKYCPGPHFATCPICGKKFEITNDYFLTHEVKSCASYECRKAAREKTSMERYGIKAPGNNPEARKKASNTMIKHIGVPYAMMSEDVRNKSKKTLLDRYGVDNISKNEDIKKKRHNTVMKKYGGVYPYNSPETREKANITIEQRYGKHEALACESIREKSKKTMLERYGVEAWAQNKELRDEYKKTIQQRFGVDEIFKSNEAREKAKKTMLERYGVDNAAKSEILKEKSRKTKLEHYPIYEGSEIQKKYTETMMKKYGVPYSCLLSSAQTKKTKSKTNYKFLKFLNDNNIEISESDMEFHIMDRSYDFKIPNTNILIEIDPTYTHNAIGNHFNKKGITTTYHLMKTRLAAENGYRCIHVFDWNDWNDILHLIQPRKSIFARKTRLYVIKNKSLVNNFLNDNHLQGTVRGQLLCLGLVYDDELIQLMTFGKPRYNKKYDCELLRLCTKQGISVVGGSSKLFSYATKYMSMGKIISYCDLSKFTGDVYEKIGMSLSHTTSPAKVWSKGANYITSNMLAARGFDQIFGTDYGKGTDNEKLMIDSGWLPVYDCGQAVYEIDSLF